MSLQQVVQLAKESTTPLSWLTGSFGIAVLGIGWKGLRMLRGLEVGQAQITAQFSAHTEEDDRRFGEAKDGRAGIERRMDGLGHVVGQIHQTMTAEGNRVIGAVTEIVGNAQMSWEDTKKAVEKTNDRIDRLLQDGGE